MGPNMRFTEFSHVGKPLFPACFKIHLQTVWDLAAMIRTLNVFLVARYVFLALESMFYFFLYLSIVGAPSLWGYLYIVGQTILSLAGTKQAYMKYISHAHVMYV